MASNSTPAATGPPVVHTAGSGNSILVNTCQRGNPILEHIRNVAKEWADIVPDFQVGRTSCVLFLSLKYHRLHPEYIHQRIQRLAHMYTLRILLIHCDITEHHDSIRELTKICLINNITIVVAWSPEECGLYLSTYKVYEHKPPDAIRERVDKDHMSILRAALTSVRSVNKTDVTTLKTTFGSFAGIAKATPEQLVKCPGIGQTKARRIKDAFEHPFHSRALTTTAEDMRPLNAARARQPGAMGPPSVPARAQQTGSQTERTAARPPRSPSPAWSIELDLNEDDDVLEPSSSTASKPSEPPAVIALESSRPIANDAPLNPRKRAPRSPSPVWDIELDLNDDEMAELARLDTKRPRLDPDAKQ